VTVTTIKWFGPAIKEPVVNGSREQQFVTGQPGTAVLRQRSFPELAGSVQEMKPAHSLLRFSTVSAQYPAGGSSETQKPALLARVLSFAASAKDISEWQAAKRKWQKSTTSAGGEA
jgi:hypothetical protein